HPAAPAQPAPQTPVPQTQTQPQIQPPTAAPPTTAAQAPPVTAPTGAAPTGASTPPAPVGVGPVVSLRVEPPNIAQAVGATFTAQITASGAQDLYSAPMQISFDPAKLQVTGVANGDMLSRDGQAVALVHREDAQAGTIQVNATRPPGSGGLSGNGVLYVLTFQAKAPGESQIIITRPSLRNAAMNVIGSTPGMATVTVK